MGRGAAAELLRVGWRGWRGLTPGRVAAEVGPQVEARWLKYSGSGRVRSGIGGNTMKLLAALAALNAAFLVSIAVPPSAEQAAARLSAAEARATAAAQGRAAAVESADAPLLVVRLASRS
jgi:hypothetical protein